MHIYLYLKTHKTTGLKYLGMTTQDPFKYCGSGDRWLRHLKKHGNNIHTEILFESQDEHEFSRVALEYSEKFDVVNSEEFANLVPEDGRLGCFGIVHSKEGLRRIAESSKKRNQGPNNPMFGRTHTPETKRLISEQTKGKMLGVPKSAETKRKMSESTRMNTCPHCATSYRGSGIYRWHFDNCKEKSK